VRQLHSFRSKPFAVLLNATAIASILTIGVASRAGAQQSELGLVPTFARALVVRIDSRFTDEDAEVGAGIVVGLDQSNVYIATARHVVRKGTVPATSVTVLFASPTEAYGDTASATVLDHNNDRIDLAVISVPRAAIRSVALTEKTLDRLGDVGAIGFRSPVAPVGCPSECWRVSVTREQVIGVGREEMIVEAGAASNMGPGSSGGALFNDHWEVVAMVTQHGAPRAYAIPIDVVIDQLRFWHVPVTLRRPSIPRGGYRTVVQASILAPSGADEEFVDADRLPSGRVTLLRQARAPWSFTASVMRLAPRNLGVTAGMVGLAASLRMGRLTLQPFTELGLGRVEGRFDGGGVTVVAPDTVYVPRWEQARVDGLGFGAGMDVQVLLLPRVILGAMVGRWTFSSPPRVPAFPSYFFGAGLRYGLGS
jgi:Trypsin-like peptidase domain